MRRMVVVASVLSIMVLVVTIGSALALDCHGGVVVSGASPWEVKERCGEPTTIDDMMKHLHQRTYDPYKPGLCRHPRAGAAEHLDLQFWLDALPL